MTDSLPPDSERNHRVMHSEEIGEFITNFLESDPLPGPRSVSARVLVEALLNKNRINPRLGAVEHLTSIRDVEISRLHALTISATIEAESELQKYRDEHLALPYMHQRPGEHPEILIEFGEDSLDITWSDYTKLMAFIYETIKISYYAVSTSGAAVDHYTNRLRYRLAVALSILCLLSDYGTHLMGEPHIRAQMRILRTIKLHNISPGFEHKTHVRPPKSFKLGGSPNKS
jgi:hypothetical protein